MKKHLRSGWICRAAGVCSMAWLIYALAGQADTGTLRVEILDNSTGSETPAMVCITSLADGKWRTPPDGRVVPPSSTTRDFHNPPPWKPGEIGPVRLTLGDYKRNDLRSIAYEGGPALPYWREPAIYFVPRGFSIALPAGKWRLAVARGIEYLPVFEEFEIRAGEQRARKVRLNRWVSMPKRGWYSGDGHSHHPRTRPEHDEFLMTWARAEDVHVMNILRYGDLRATYCEQAAYGKAGRFLRGDYVLVSGQEDPRTDIGQQGHTLALNITAPVRDTSQYRLYDFMFDGVHRQGGLVGYAHKSWAQGFYQRANSSAHATWDSSINVIRDKVDFFEILQFSRLGLEDYYDFLSLGCKLTAMAGSDLPWGATAGEVRVYAYTGERFSPDAWFEAVKRGRTFVTNGPMLELTANDALPGGEVKVGVNGKVRVRARAWAPPSIGAPRRLEVVANGQVIRTAESQDPGRPQLALDFTIHAEAGQWIVARTESHNQALAHTSPIYVLTGSESFRDRGRLPQLVAKRLGVLDYIESQLRNDKPTAAWAPGELAALNRRVADARMRYRQLLKTP